MKTGLLIAALAFSFVGTAQNTEVFTGEQTKEGVFFEYNMGARFAGAKSDQVTLDAGLHMNGAIGYMFNGIIGIRGVLGLNTFKTVDVIDLGVEDRSYMIGTTLEGVLSIDQLANFGTPGFGLMYHMGFGFSSIVNPSWKEDKLAVAGFNFEDPAFKGNDDVVNIVFGLTPQYIISDKISINADFSFVLLMKQDHTLDRFNNVDVEGTTNYMNSSVGITYKL